jgi:hypothetical protein
MLAYVMSIDETNSGTGALVQFQLCPSPATYVRSDIKEEMQGLWWMPRKYFHRIGAAIIHLQMLHW